MDLIPARGGHFLLESGHHGELWLDLELLCRSPDRVAKLAKKLAKRLQPLEVEVVCGPLVEGAFLALLVASELGADFMYTERHEAPKKVREIAESAGIEQSLFPVRYQLPAPLRDLARGKRVALVNDVINAGSAVRGTLEQFCKYELEAVAIGSLLTLGPAAEELAQEHSLELITLASLHNPIWEPHACPLCFDWKPLENPGGFPTG